MYKSSQNMWQTKLLRFLKNRRHLMIFQITRFIVGALLYTSFMFHSYSIIKTVPSSLRVLFMFHFCLIDVLDFLAVNNKYSKHKYDSIEIKKVLSYSPLKKELNLEDACEVFSRTMLFSCYKSSCFAINIVVKPVTWPRY